MRWSKATDPERCGRGCMRFIPAVDGPGFIARCEGDG